MKHSLAALAIICFAMIRANAAPPTPLTTHQCAEGVLMIWQQVSQQFPIRDRIGEFKINIDLAVKEASGIESTAAYYAALDRLVATLSDGHTFVVPPAGTAFKRSKPSVGVALIDGEAVVNWVRNDLAKDIPLGSRVKAVDGQAPFQVAQERALKVSASTVHRRHELAMSRILEGESGSLVRIEYITPAGERRTKSLERGAAWPEGTEAVFLQGFESPRTVFRAFDAGSISYFSARDFRDRSIYSAFVSNMAAIRASRAVIFDVRKNSGGDSEIGLDILSHFLTSPMAEGVTRKTNARIAAEEASTSGNLPESAVIHLVEQTQSVIQPRPAAERITLPLVILTDHGTMSAAEDFVSFASALGAKRVGQVTAGSTGEMARIPLPGGGTFFALIKWDKAMTGEEFVGIGFHPHVPAGPTVADLVEGRDPILAKGLEVARSLMR